jgi:subfamily B ATP-binding cassette protein MsbA
MFSRSKADSPQKIILRRLIHEARPYWPRLMLSLLLATIAGTGLLAFAPAFNVLVKFVLNDTHQDLVVPALGIHIMSLAWLTHPFTVHDPHHDPHFIWWIIGALFMVNLIANAASYTSAYLTAWSGQHLVTDLRTRLLERVLRMPPLDYDAWRPGELLARSTNDLSLMGEAVSVTLPQFVQVVVTFIGSLAFMAYTDIFLTVVLLVIAPVISLAVARFNGLISTRSNEAQKRIAELTANLSEVLQGQRVVKAFRREAYEVERFRRNSNRFFQASLSLTQLMQLQIPIVGMMIVVTLLAVVYLSAREVTLGHMDAGSVFQFWTLVTLSINPMNRIAAYLGDMSRGLIGVSRVYEILDLPIEQDIADDPIVLENIAGTLQFDQVQFCYPKSPTPILDNFSLDIPAGTVIALVGPSGAGKSTIAQLVPRFYDIGSGAIRIDSVDIRQLSLTQLRESIGIVPQEPQLFRGTIAENIRYGRLDATEEDVHNAAREANAEEFIVKLPDGYDTLLGESGTRLSGGQRQRIAIARAIVRDPKIIILDEATSALDSHSELLIEEAFDRVFAGRTTIVIAHRLSTIRRADRILYVESGSIRESGTHGELLEAGGLYARLYSTQNR